MSVFKIRIGLSISSSQFQACLSWKLNVDAMIGLPHNSVNAVLSANGACWPGNILLSRRYFAAQLHQYRNVRFQATSTNRPPLYIWLKLPQRTPVGMCRDGNCGEAPRLPSKCYVHVQIPPHGVPSQLLSGDVLHRVATWVLRNGGTLQPLPRSYRVGTRQRGAMLQRSHAVTL